jgi:hypothetical protein
MILMIRNECIFKAVTGTKMKQLENSMQTHEADL